MKRRRTLIAAAGLAACVFAAGCGASTHGTQSGTTQRQAEARPTAVAAPPTETTVAPNSPRITLDEFSSINAGMTLDQVTATVGSPGTVNRATDRDATETRWWDGPPRSDGFAMVTFRDGIVFGKTQVGLP
jgi:hypothetical protein